ncbi:hypothetical protein CRUP_028783 [Coryphaenoides rupestris]|nr:hypothetical protein CRUP_028783 [Coryphaenoides rupestris]
MGYPRVRHHEGRGRSLPRRLMRAHRSANYIQSIIVTTHKRDLLQDPIAPTDSSCQHYVCRGCKGQRMQLKPSCSWCKDYSRFQENRQLSLLVHCYKKLCLYIARSPLTPHIAAHD